MLLDLDELKTPHDQSEVWPESAVWAAFLDLRDERGLVTRSKFWEFFASVSVESKDGTSKTSTSSSSLKQRGDLVFSLLNIRQETEAVGCLSWEEFRHFPRFLKSTEEEVGQLAKQKKNFVNHKPLVDPASEMTKCECIEMGLNQVLPPLKIRHPVTWGIVTDMRAIRLDLRSSAHISPGTAMTGEDVNDPMGCQNFENLTRVSRVAQELEAEIDWCRQKALQTTFDKQSSRPLEEIMTRNTKLATASIHSSHYASMKLLRSDLREERLQDEAPTEKQSRLELGRGIGTLPVRVSLPAAGNGEEEQIWNYLDATDMPLL